MASSMQAGGWGTKTAKALAKAVLSYASTMPGGVEVSLEDGAGSDAGGAGASSCNASTMPMPGANQHISVLSMPLAGDDDGYRVDADSFVAFPKDSNATTMFETFCAPAERKLKRDATLQCLRDNEKAQGSMTDLVWSSPNADKMKEDFRFGGDECPALLDHAGAGPWVRTVRKWGWQWDATKLPLPGVASLNLIMDDELWLMAFNVPEILKMGSTLQDFQNCLETTSGQAYLTKSAKVFSPLPSGTLVWAPNGWVLAPVLLPRKGPSCEYASYVTQALFLPKTSAALPSMDAIVSHLIEKIQGKAGSSMMWKKRFDTVQEFSKLMKS